MELSLAQNRSASRRLSSRKRKIKSTAYTKVPIDNPIQTPTAPSGVKKPS